MAAQATLVRSTVGSPDHFLGSRRWWQSTDPFPHVIARDALRANVYAELDACFAELLRQGLHEQARPGQLSRGIRNYDAYAMSFPARLDNAFGVFHSRVFHDLVAQTMGIEATGDVNGGIHHHKPGSASGTPHNDFNPGYFIDAPRPDGINPSDDTQCDYRSGRTTGTRTSRETVRAIAVLFYLHNGPWQQGDGGETALYAREKDGFHPVVRVPPIDNSLLLFECRPDSYHGFLQNRRTPRNSIILWLHRSRNEVVNRWGEDSIVRWPQS
jgi:hypothetical protein